MRWQTLTSLSYGVTGLMYFNCECATASFRGLSLRAHGCWLRDFLCWSSAVAAPPFTALHRRSPPATACHRMSPPVTAFHRLSPCCCRCGRSLNEARCVVVDPPGAIVSINGTLGPLAAPARRVNTLLLAYAPYLLHAASTDVWLVPARAAARAAGAHLLVLGVKSKLPTLVGSFRLEDGRAAALVQNQAWETSSDAVVTFAGGLSGVRRVDPGTGAEVAVESRSVRLVAGGAELYVSAS